MTNTLRTVTSTYRAGNAYFICDRCSQRWRRSSMLTEWDNLKVCPVCIDPRPPQMTPPNVYPEGIPFFDARSPQDNPDRMTDDTSLQPVSGGIATTVGQYAYQNGQQLPDGAVSPSDIIENPAPQGPSVLEDDITIRTGPIAPPTAPGVD